MKELLFSRNSLRKILIQVGFIAGVIALFLFCPKPVNAAWMEAGGVQCYNCIYNTDGSLDTAHAEIWLYAVDDAIPGATIYDKRITNASVSIRGVAADECAPSGQHSQQGLGYNSSSSGRVGLRESCWHRMTLSASAPGYDSISYDINVAPGDCNVAGLNGDVLDYYAHLIRNTPPLTGGINVTYRCLSDNTHVSVDLDWGSANPTQKYLWVDKNNDGSLDINQTISSSIHTYSFGLSDGFLENTSNDFAIISGGTPATILARNKNNRAQSCPEGGGNPPGGGTNPPNDTTPTSSYWVTVQIYEDNGGTYGVNDGGRLLSASDWTSMHVYIDSYSNEMGINTGHMPYGSEFREFVSGRQNHTILFSVDPGWEAGPRYTYKVEDSDCHSHAENANYLASSPSPSYPSQEAVMTGSVPYVGCYSSQLNHTNYFTTVYLGVKKGNKPDFQVNSPALSSGTNFEATNDTITMSGIVVNLGQFPVDSYNVRTGFLIDGVVKSEATATVSTGMNQAYVSSTIAGNTLTVGPHTLRIWADYLGEIPESNENNNYADLSFTVGPPADQWLKTEKGGDVGVKGAINTKFLPSGQSNAEYLVVAERVISGFSSVKSWLVQKYPNIISPSLSIYPQSASNFDSLFDEYRKNGSTPPAQLTTTNLSSIAGASSSILYSTGDVTLGGNYAGGPKVVFVYGKLTISSDLKFTGTDSNAQGLILVVKETTTILAATVREVNAVIISYGKFSTTDDYVGGCGTKPMTGTFHSPLNIKGAVYSLSSQPNTACFNRNIGKAISPRPPAELITFEPKYLVLFKDLIGETVTSFKETTP